MGDVGEGKGRCGGVKKCGGRCVGEYIGWVWKVWACKEVR